MNDIITQIKNQWFLLAFLVGMIIWYANTNSRITAVEAKVIEQSSLVEQIATLKTDVAVIKANVEFIKQQVR